MAWIMAVMWLLTAITLVFVVLRLYVRIRIIGTTGPDDYVYALSGILFLLYTLFMQVSSIYGFGRNIFDLTLDNAVTAVKLEMIGQTFAVIGMATAKISLGLFLLRIVVITWHRVLIWTTVISLLAVSVLTATVFWIQCIPIEHLFDPRVGGRCLIPIHPFSILLGSWCAATDFFQACFPWLFIRNLSISYREKMTIAGSMSLGIIAGVCGIVRTIELGGISSRNYTFDTVNLIVWSAAELAVTMICIGIPTVGRPMWRKFVGETGASYNRYYRRSEGTDAAPSDSFRMNKMAGGDCERNPSAMGVRGGTTLTQCGHGPNESNEEILGPEFRQGQTSNGHGHDGIRVTEAVRVEVETRAK